MAFATFDTRVSDVRGLSLTAEISIIAVSESPTALRVGTLKGGRYAQTADLCTASDRRCDHGSGAFAAKKANNIPKQFLDAILGDLRNAGVVHSRKGPGGGYSLARAASEIKIGHIIRTIDGPLAPLACASRTAYQPLPRLQGSEDLHDPSCNDEGPRCYVRRVNAIISKPRRRASTPSTEYENTKRER
jgi:Rrf2 family protein